MVLDLILVQNFYYLTVSMGKISKIFRADMNSLVHIVNKKKDILILGEEPTQRLNDTTLTAEAKYPISFTLSGKRFVLSLQYNESNSFLFINSTKIHQFTANYSEIKKYPLLLGNILGDFGANNMKNQD